MWKATVEIVGISRPKLGLLTSYGDRDATSHDNASFFAWMRKKIWTRIAARCIHFSHDLQVWIGYSGWDHPQGHAASTDLEKLLCLEEWLNNHFNIDSEELGQGHRHGFRELSQGGDGGTDSPLLDHGNGTVGNASTSGQVSLGETVTFSKCPQATPSVVAIGGESRRNFLSGGLLNKMSGFLWWLRHGLVINHACDASRKPLVQYTNM